MSLQGLIGCFAVTGGGLAATAALGGLRLVDLIVAGAVMVVMIVLALGDSRNLSLAVMAVWMYAPLLRRIVDWQSGGYVSVTALSLLPTMATSALLIRVYPRMTALPRWLIQPVLLIMVPVLLAVAAGVFAYGPSAIVEASVWLMPLLFLFDAATRPLSEPERHRLLRGIVLLAGASAAYGIYQFLSPPDWDRLWLIQSGMTSSMGKAEAQQLRVWGTLNDTGLAAGVWALALITAFAERHWKPVLRYIVMAVLAVALCMTLVRTCWLVAVAGITAYLLLRGSGEGIAMAASALIAGMVLMLAVPLLPGGERIIQRATTFGDLQNDSSYQARSALAAGFIDQVTDAPLGVGIGFQTASKVGGKSTNVEAFDNGYANVVVTLGFAGASALLLGMAMLFRGLTHVQHRNSDATFAALARAVFVTLALSTVAAISFIGLPGVWLWWTLGLAAAPAELPRVSRAPIGADDV